MCLFKFIEHIMYYRHNMILFYLEIRPEIFREKSWKFQNEKICDINHINFIYINIG